MKILITGPGEYTPNSTDLPVVGRYYTLEDAANGTGAQNRAFHALLGEYYKSGLCSYDCKSFDDFRNQIKRKLGPGFESYAYADIVKGLPVLEVVDKYDEIPEVIRKDPRLREYVRGRLKSWADYTKKERRDTMDKLIAEMKMAGVNSKKFDEIMEGMKTIW
jgi:hypothetical protein